MFRAVVLASVLCVTACGPAIEPTAEPEAVAEVVTPEQTFEEAERCFTAAASYGMFLATTGQDPEHQMINHAMTLRPAWIAAGAALGKSEEVLIAEGTAKNDQYIAQFIEAAPDDTITLSTFGRQEVDHCNLDEARAGQGGP